MFQVSGYSVVFCDIYALNFKDYFAHILSNFVRKNT